MRWCVPNSLIVLLYTAVVFCATAMWRAARASVMCIELVYHIVAAPLLAAAAADAAPTPPPAGRSLLFWGGDHGGTPRRTHHMDGRHIARARTINVQHDKTTTVRGRRW